MPKKRRPECQLPVLQPHAAGVDIGAEEVFVPAAESAGLEPGTLNPLVVEAMKEVGIDISQKKTQAVFDVWKTGKLFQYVIAVCAESEEKGCPIFPGVTTRLSWPFPDPSRVEGTDEERLRQVRTIRDSIRARIERWCEEMRG